ncbi:hypothetical protein V6N11_070901 [Hibiscus sabdariffa]|uniref:Uncharacterized protein n=1 Tax=Hibiscus sabdariffa TaxID=183260 RepID=A0ABR1ZR90_9ROSI
MPCLVFLLLHGDVADGEKGDHQRGPSYADVEENNILVVDMAIIMSIDAVVSWFDLGVRVEINPLGLAWQGRVRTSTTEELSTNLNVSGGANVAISLMFGSLD